MFKIKKGDLVEVSKGKDRGKRGRLLAVRPQDRRVVVEGLNLVRRHRRPRKAGQKGQIVSLPRAIPASSVMAVCGACGKPVRIGIRLAEGSKSRVCKKCGHKFS